MTFLRFNVWFGFFKVCFLYGDEKRFTCIKTHFGVQEVSFEFRLTLLQSVDVLGVHSQQQAFVVKHADEVVDVVGSMAARIQNFG